MPAPDVLSTLQAFLNSADLVDGTDQLESTARARAWFAAHSVPGTARLSDADRAYACRVREAVRDVVEANTGATPPTASVDLVNAELGLGHVRPVVGPDGSLSIVSGGAGVHRALGYLLAEMVRSQADGTWARFKTCSNDECRWAFYDRSRNHSGTWCEMRTCGSRHKMRAYRARAAKT